MPLFRGFVTHKDPYMTLSYLTDVGGSHGRAIWDFLHSTKAYSATLRNVLCFELDARSMEEARRGVAIKANLRLSSEFSKRGTLICSATGRKFVKDIILLPFRQIPVRVNMFKPWGSVTTESVLLFDPPEIPLQLSINMIPVTEEEELPYDAPYPLTSVSTSEVSTCTSDSTEDSEDSAAPPLRIPIFIEPSAELNSTESLNGSEGRNESTLQSGLFIHDDTGRVNLVARRSDSQNAPSMLHFSPMATSTSETPTNNQIHQAGGLRVQIPEDVNEPGPSTAPPRLYDEESAVVSNMAQPRSRSTSPPAKRRKITTLQPRPTTPESRYRVKRHPVANSGETLTREEALANRVRTPTPPIERFRTPTPPVLSRPLTPRPFPENNNSISPVKIRSNITISIPDTPDTSAEAETAQNSFEGQQNENLVFLTERMEAAEVRNSSLDNLRPRIRTAQMMNATIPPTPNPRWDRDPNSPQQDIIPEHVALLVDPGENTVMRTLFFWEAHNPWHIIQAMIHEDVTIYPNGQVDEEDIFDPRPWSPNHVPSLSSANATAGTLQDITSSLMEVDTVLIPSSMSIDPTTTSAEMSFTCNTMASQGQSRSSVSNMSISEASANPPEPDDLDQEGEDERRGEKEKGSHA